MIVCYKKLCSKINVTKLTEYYNTVEDDKFKTFHYALMNTMGIMRLCLVVASCSFSWLVRLFSSHRVTFSPTLLVLDYVLNFVLFFFF